MSQALCNNASIRLTGFVPDEAIKKLEDFLDEDSIYFDLNEDASASILNIEEAYGDLSYDLNAIVNVLRQYGIEPLVGEYNRYYGDYDGYDVFNGAFFISMDEEDYGAWLNERAHADTFAVAKKIVDYCKSHKEEANSVYGAGCTEGKDFIPAELRALIDELEKTLQK